MKICGDKLVIIYNYGYSNDELKTFIYGANIYAYDKNSLTYITQKNFENSKACFFNDQIVIFEQDSVSFYNSDFNVENTVKINSESKYTELDGYIGSNITSDGKYICYYTNKYSEKKENESFYYNLETGEETLLDGEKNIPKYYRFENTKHGNIIASKSYTEDDIPYEKFSLLKDFKEIDSIVLKEEKSNSYHTKISSSD